MLGDGAESPVVLDTMWSKYASSSPDRDPPRPSSTSPSLRT